MLQGQVACFASITSFNPRSALQYMQQYFSWRHWETNVENFKHLLEPAYLRVMEINPNLGMCSSEVSAASTATLLRSWAQKLDFLCGHAYIHTAFSCLLGYSRQYYWSPPLWKLESVFFEVGDHAEVLAICLPKVEKAREFKLIKLEIST